MTSHALRWKVSTNDFMPAREHVLGQATGQYEFGDAQDASSRFQSRWKSVFKQAKATERHLTRVVQQVSEVQTKLVP